LPKKDYSETLEEKLKYIRKGVPGEYLQEGLDSDAKNNSEWNRTSGKRRFEI
jgi:hypothetical protein